MAIGVRYPSKHAHVELLIACACEPRQNRLLLDGQLARLLGLLFPTHVPMMTGPNIFGTSLTGQSETGPHALGPRSVEVDAETRVGAEQTEKPVRSITGGGRRPLPQFPCRTVKNQVIQTHRASGASRHRGSDAQAELPSPRHGVIRATEPNRGTPRYQGRNNAVLPAKPSCGHTTMVPRALIPLPGEAS